MGVSFGGGVTAFNPAVAAITSGTIAGITSFAMAATSTSTASGNVNFHSNICTVSPSAQSSTVFSGGLNQLTFSGSASTAFDAVGHVIAGLDYCIVNASGSTVALAFASEGKFEVQAGTVTNAGSVRAGLADVASGATLTTWSGVSIGITDSHGTLTNAKGADFSITTVSGTAISNCFAYNAQDVSTSKATNYAAFRSQATAATGHYGLYFDGNAQSVHAGKFRIGSTTAPTVELDVTGAGKFSGLLATAASATGGAGLNLPHGAAPTSPVNGDMWTTTAGLYVRINGATVGPLT